MYVSFLRLIIRGLRFVNKLACSALPSIPANKTFFFFSSFVFSSFFYFYISSSQFFLLSPLLQFGSSFSPLWLPMSFFSTLLSSLFSNLLSQIFFSFLPSISIFLIFLFALILQQMGKLFLLITFYGYFMPRHLT